MHMNFHVLVLSILCLLGVDVFFILLTWLRGYLMDRNERKTGRIYPDVFWDDYYRDWRFYTFGLIKPPYL